MESLARCGVRRTPSLVRTYRQQMDAGDARDLVELLLPRRWRRWIIRAVVVVLALVTLVSPATGQRATRAVMRPIAESACAKALTIFFHLLPDDFAPSAASLRAQSDQACRL